MLWPTCTFLILLRMSLNVVLICRMWQVFRACFIGYFKLGDSQSNGWTAMRTHLCQSACVCVCVFTWVLPAFTVREYNNWQQADSGHCLKLFLKCMNFFNTFKLSHMEKSLKLPLLLRLKFKGNSSKPKNDNNLLLSAHPKGNHSQK